MMSNDNAEIVENILAYEQVWDHPDIIDENNGKKWFILEKSSLIIRRIS